MPWPWLRMTMTNTAFHHTIRNPPKDPQNIQKAPLFLHGMAMTGSAGCTCLVFP